MKKTFRLTVFATILVNTFLIAQNTTKTLAVDYANLSPATAVALSLGDDERDLLIKPGNKIVVKITNVTGGYNTDLRVNAGPIANLTNSEYEIDATREVSRAISDGLDVKSLDVKQSTDNAIKHKIKLTWNKITPEEEKSKAEVATLTSRQDELDKVTAQPTFNKPYDYKNNRINLFFDEKGKLLNFLPVNVDANDYFYCYVICPVKDQYGYRVNTTEGDFSPVDLSIRPSVKPIQAFARGENNKYSAISYTVAELRAGPFTSDNFKFQIAFDSVNGRTINGPLYSFKINKLYHVGVGVSIVRTGLESPDFRVAPIASSTVNTIEKYNDGGRTILTFNVMWYWSVLQQKRQGSIITSGRDILKDEPTFSFHRIFPTLGVNLDKKLNENIFVGIVYEFARGGSLIAGVHYGRVKELSDKSFSLSNTPFAGTTSDIRTNNVYKPAFFFGVNVDTRIFNTLFGRGE